jgi:PAS domain S-box-containing protein
MSNTEILTMDNNASFGQWKELLNAIQKFTDIGHNRKSISDIYREGISVFGKFPKSNHCALYILDENHYQFDLKITLPEKSDIYISEIFDYLVESGNIGLAIDSSSVINISLETFNSTKQNVFIIPLRVRKGINGIGLILHENNSNELEQFLYQFIGLFANLLGTTIENYKIHNELEISKSTLEQKIATRTLDLAQSRRELKAIFDSVLTGVLVFDLTINKIVRVNPMACKIIGECDSNIVGKNVFDYLDYYDYSKINDLMGNQNYYESKLFSAENKEIIVLRNTTKLLLNNRVLINESFVDISKIKEAEMALNHTNQLLELKVIERTEDLHILVHKLKDEIKDKEEAEAKIRRMYEEQKELSELKTRFVSMVSHEFRTPLTLIKSSAQMVTKFKDKLAEDEKNHYLERIVFSVDSLTDLIENVIFIGKNDSDRYKVYIDKFDLNKLIGDIVNFFLLNNLETVKFEVKISENANFVYTDKRLLKIILNNLISNAIKYSKGNPKICLEADVIDNILIISVSDFGIGVPADELDKIFDLFYRAKNVNSINGTGLGLTVVTESLYKLSGRIEIKSIVNEGSVFKIFIPLPKEY